MESYASYSKFFLPQFNESNLKTTGGDLPLEIMVAVKKFDEIGYYCDFDAKECCIKLEYKYDYTKSYLFKWYPNTNDQDLAVYFEDVYYDLKSKKNLTHEGCNESN